MDKKSYKKPQLTNIESLESSLDYKFKDKKRLLEALTHKSMKQPYNNERLEFIGDAVLDLVVAEFLFFEFDKKNEGSLSKMRASLVNESSFCKMANSIQLGNYINLSLQEENSGGRTKASILSDTFEALIAVIYLESGLDSVKHVFYSIMQREFSITEELLPQDYKSVLQEYTQENFACIPVYEIKDESGPDHNKTFLVEVYINGKACAVGSGGSKKAAQQEAAKIAYLNLIKN